LHALALRSAGVRIGRVYDPNLAQAELLASVIGGEATARFEDVERSAAHVAAICSPPHAHARQAVLLARRWRLTFVEKPIALSRDELLRLADLPNVVPVLQWRMGAGLVALREAMLRGAFGPAPRLSARCAWSRDASYFADGRRGLTAWGAGALLSIGIHAIDAMLWASGRSVESVRGFERRTREAVDVPTFAEVEVDLSGGARLELTLTLDEPSCSRTSLAIEGDGVRAEIVGTEEDPTACALRLKGAYDDAIDLSAATRGARGSPLLVPFVHAALQAFEARALEGPATVESALAAHDVAFRIARGATGSTPP
jgi:predicted dehydrogenase